MADKLQKALLEDLVEEARDITPTVREAALLASLDEADVKKFAPTKTLDETITQRVEAKSVTEPAEEEPVEEEAAEEVEEETEIDEEQEGESEEVIEEEEKEEEDVPYDAPTETMFEEPVEEEPVEEVEPVEEEPSLLQKIDEMKEEAEQEEKALNEASEAKVPGKFEVYPEDDEFKYRLKANNGEILVVSYGYSTREGAHAGVETLKKNLESGVVAYITDKNNHSQWRLSTNNDSRIVALGETYASLTSAQNAFASTQKFGKTERIVDLDEIPNDERRSWKFTVEPDVEKDSGTIEIFDDGGKFKARLLANNQEVLFVTAQAYASKASLKSSLDNIKEKLSPTAFHLSKDKQDRYQFIMESGSGFVYLVGETYNSGATARSAARSVLAFINKATLVDLTLKAADADDAESDVKKEETKE